MLAHVTLDTGPRETVMLVHKDALVLEPNKPPRVWVAENDPATNGTRVREVPVQVGEAAGSLVRVVGELRSGQQVIVLGNERVFPGQPVRAVTRTPEQPPPAPGKS